jgi:hypothetical protein
MGTAVLLGLLESVRTHSAGDASHHGACDGDGHDAGPEPTKTAKQCASGQGAGDTCTVA